MVQWKSEHCLNQSFTKYWMLPKINNTFIEFLLTHFFVNSDFFKLIVSSLFFIKHQHRKPCTCIIQGKKLIMIITRDLINPN